MLSKNRIVAFLVTLFTVLSLKVYAAYDFITVDATTGEVAFDPAKIIAPLLLVIVAIVGSVGAFWIVRAGIRWLIKLIST